MIAGEYAETAGIEWERIVYTKFGAEISDWMFRCYRRITAGLRRHVRIETAANSINAFQVNRIGCNFGEPVGRKLGQQFSWIVFALFPKLRIEIRSEEHTSELQ